jgi:hypothetical protein
MRRSQLIRTLALVAIVAAVLSVVFWVSRMQDPPAPSSFQSQPPKKESTAEPIRRQTPTSKATAWTSQGPPRQPSGEERVQRILGDPDFDWKTPIEFYGKVVDERSIPVEGARISFMWTDLSAQGTSTRETTSDQQGLFSLSGVRGKRLVVTSVTKEGYYTSFQSNRFSFEYANPHETTYHEPDATNPVVFLLKRKGQAEPLVNGLTLFGFKPDGTRYFLDLVQGKNKREPPGDLIVQFLRGESNRARKFDWSVKFDVPEGGLLETTEEFMFTAPAEGYQPSIEIVAKADDPNWPSQVKRRFYLVSRNGKCYGRLEATIIPAYNQISAIDLTYFVNTNSSRNLEYDPAVQPKPKFLE